MGKNEIIWKSFCLNELFEFSSGNTFALKDYNLFETNDVNVVEVVTSSKDSTNNKYICKDDIPSNCPIYKNAITINRNGSIGYCNYHKEEYIIPTGDSYTLIHKNKKLEDILSIDSNLFLAKILTNIFTSDNYGYNYKVNSDRFSRELILLPCLEVKSSDEYIWEENGRYFTLAVDYINKLMDKAKELKEQKTIRFYEKEKAKYEKEKAKYEKEKAKYEKAYLEEKKKVVWKGYILEDLFDRKTPPSTKTVAKELTIYDEPFDGSVALITRAETNNGIRGYIEKSDYDTLTNSITYNDQFSFFKYHNYEFTTIKDHLSIIICKNDKLQNILDKNEYINLFFVNILNHIYSKEIFNFNFTGAEYRFDREIILLPFFENEDVTSMIENNDKYYILAINYISYLYLQGRCNYYQKLIDKYTYQY